MTVNNTHLKLVFADDQANQADLLNYAADMATFLREAGPNPADLPLSGAADNGLRLILDGIIDLIQRAANM